MMRRRAPWQRYIEAAVNTAVDETRSNRPATAPADNRRATTPAENRHTTTSSDLGAKTRPTHGAARDRLSTAVAPVRQLASRWTTGAADSEEEPRTLDVRLVPAALAAWAAGVVGVRLEPGTSAVLAAAAAATAVGILLLKLRGSEQRALLAAGLPLCCAALVALSAAQSMSARSAGPIAAAIDTHAVVTAQLRVTADPVAGAPDQFSNEPRYLIEAKLISATAAGRKFEADTPVVALGGREWASVLLGEVVGAAGTLLPTEPGDSAAALFAARTVPTLQAAAPLWQQYIADLRARFRMAAGELPGDAAGLLPGMVLGDRSLQAPPLEDAMQRSGLTHLTAVSGANCSILIGFVLLCAYSARCPRPPAVAVSLLALIGFVLVVRPEPSVLRAAVMGTVGIAAVLSGRGRRSTALLSIAVITLLIADPWLGTSYAFILSVLATTGLVYCGRPCARFLARWIPLRFAQVLTVPIAAQAFCAPVIILLQPQLPLYSVPANVLVAPVIAPVTILGMAAVLALMLCPPAAPLLIGLAGAGAGWVAAVARFFSSAPGAALPWLAGPLGAALLALCILSVTAGLWAASRAASGKRRPPRGQQPPRRRRRLGWPVLFPLIALATLLAGAMVVLLPVSEPQRSSRDWSIAACDVGQGDGLVLHTGEGSAIVVDTGPDPHLMDQCLQDLQISTIELLVLTHMHLDHTGGVAGVLDGRAVHTVLVPAGSDIPGPVGQLLAERELAPTAAGAGLAGVAGTARWSVLWPPAQHYAADENNASIVMAVQLATGTALLNVLLTGDLETDGLAALLSAGARDPATAQALDELADQGLDVLKVAHHGAANGGVALIERFRPATALISVGADNDYGHPHAAILDSLRAAGTRIGRTDEHGTIRVNKEGGTLTMTAAR